MYTFKYFVFGHHMAVSKRLNNVLREEYDMSFKCICKNKTYTVDYPYHWGQVSGDTYSLIFGTIIATSDDNKRCRGLSTLNKQYIKEITAAKESDYIEGYNEFLAKFLEVLHTIEMEDSLIKEYQEFFAKNAPQFYEVEASKK